MTRIATVNSRVFEFAGKPRRLAAAFDEKRRLIVHGYLGCGGESLARGVAQEVLRRETVERVVHLHLGAGTDRRWLTDYLGCRWRGPEFLDTPREHRPLVLLKEINATPTLLVWYRLDEAVDGAEGDTLNSLLELGVELTQAGQTRLLVAARDSHADYVPYQPSRRVAVQEVVPLDDSSAREFAVALAEWLVRVEEKEVSEDHLRAAVAACGGNALALRLWMVLPGAPRQPDPGDAATALDAALAEFYRSLPTGQRAALAALAGCLLDGGLMDLAREVGGLSKAEFHSEGGLLPRLLLAGLAEVSPELGEDAPYLVLHPALLASPPPGLTNEARDRHCRVYLEKALEWGGGDSQQLVWALREMPNLLHALAVGLSEDRDLVAAGSDALQERLDPRPATGESLISRVVAHARRQSIPLPQMA